MAEIGRIKKKKETMAVWTDAVGFMAVAPEMEVLRQALVAWHQVWYGFLAVGVAMGFRFLSQVRTSSDHLVKKVAENCETVIFLSFFITDGGSGFGDFVGVGLLTDRWVWLWEREVWFFWFWVVDDFSRFMGLINFLGKFSSSFLESMKNSSGFTCTVLGLHLFWLCFCSGFYFLFFWIWWRLDLVPGFGFGFARDWIGCWVYFLNLGRTWRTGCYVLTKKNNKSKKKKKIIIIIIIWK